ncbi:MAG: BCD family MFS transporter [Pseudomonadota bacterium]
MTGTGLGWLGIARLGLVQAALGSIVVLTTSTLNRVMVVELALPALLPGVLVAIHYAVQIMRPRFGHGSDRGGRRTPWIVGGMAVLGLGGVVAAAATALIGVSAIAGTALAVTGFLLIGAGVGASGTSLLVLLAAAVTPARRAAAATITWVMMIAGFIVTTVVVGALLDPFSFQRLIVLTAAVSVIAFVVTVLATAGIEARTVGTAARVAEGGRGAFAAALREVLSERATRRFALFVFMSMLAYSAQDLLIEPFAGAIYAFTPGESTQLGGVQHGGVLLGMLLVALIGSVLSRGKASVLRQCMIGGCLASAAMLAGLAVAALNGAGPWPVRMNVFGLGFANGVFAVAAIGSMMALVSRGHRQRDGVRMGVWGAAQAIAFGLGGVLGTLTVDLTRWLSGSVESAYSVAFSLQALLFVAASLLAADLSRQTVRATLAAGDFRHAPGGASHN